MKSVSIAITFLLLAQVPADSADVETVAQECDVSSAEVEQNMTYVEWGQRWWKDTALDYYETYTEDSEGNSVLIKRIDIDCDEIFGGDAPTGSYAGELEYDFELSYDSDGSLDYHDPLDDSEGEPSGSGHISEDERNDDNEAGSDTPQGGDNTGDGSGDAGDYRSDVLDSNENTVDQGNNAQDIVEGINADIQELNGYINEMRAGMQASIDAQMEQTQGWNAEVERQWDAAIEAGNADHYAAYKGAVLAFYQSLVAELKSMVAKAAGRALAWEQAAENKQREFEEQVGVTEKELEGLVPLIDDVFESSGHAEEASEAIDAYNDLAQHLDAELEPPPSSQDFFDSIELSFENPSQIDDNPGAEFETPRNTPEGERIRDVQRYRNGVQFFTDRVANSRVERQAYVDLSGSVVGLADHAFVDGNIEGGNELLDIAETFLDECLGLGTGFFNDTISAGSNILSGLLEGATGAITLRIPGYEREYLVGKAIGIAGGMLFDIGTIIAGATIGIGGGVVMIALPGGGAVVAVDAAVVATGLVGTGLTMAASHYERYTTTLAKLETTNPTALPKPASTRLGRNLEAVGESRYEGFQAHHICAAKHPLAQPCQRVLEKFGIHLDHVGNGVFLPKNNTIPNPKGSTIHPRTNAYYRRVSDLLNPIKTKTRKQALDTLQRIKQQLKDGTFSF